MASTKLSMGTSTALTITLNSLASSATAARESTAVDNNTNLYLDALVTVTVVTSASTLANDKAVYVYAAGSEDGTTYSGEATGSDAAITTSSPSNLRLIGVIACPASSTTYRGVFSVALAFGGILPRKWSTVCRNYTGQALASSGNSASYTGVYTTNA